MNNLTKGERVVVFTHVDKTGIYTIGEGTVLGQYVHPDKAIVTTRVQLDNNKVVDDQHYWLARKDIVQGVKLVQTK